MSISLSWHHWPWKWSFLHSFQSHIFKIMSVWGELVSIIDLLCASYSSVRLQYVRMKSVFVNTIILGIQPWLTLKKSYSTISLSRVLLQCMFTLQTHIFQRKFVWYSVFRLFVSIFISYDIVNQYHNSNKWNITRVLFLTQNSTSANVILIWYNSSINKMFEWPVCSFF